MGGPGFVTACERKITVMKVTTRSDYVWMPSNHFNLHLSSQGKLIHKSHVHLSSVHCACNHTPLTGELRWARTSVIHASGDMLSPLARSAVSRHQVVSRQSAGMQMCPQQRFNCYDSPICHRICSLPTALGLKLVSVQDILAAWWIHPLPALSSPVSDLRVFFLPPLLLHVLHISMPLFFIFHEEILVNKTVRSKGPNHDSRGRRISLPDGVLMLQRISRCSNSS